MAQLKSDLLQGHTALIAARQDPIVLAINMAPKEQAMDRSRRLQQQSHVLATKSDMNLINAAMKGDVGCAPHLVKTLSDLGYILPDGSVRVAEPTHEMAQREKQQKKGF